MSSSNNNVAAVAMDLISMVDISGNRKRDLNLDLCLAPPSSSSHDEIPNTVPIPHIAASTSGVALDDTDDVSDDVIISSADDFAEACRNNKRRRRNFPGPEGGFLAMLREASVFEPIIIAPPPPPPPPPQVVVPAPAPAPATASFSCPICMGPFREETSTRCGHIFCKGCLMGALRVKAACPTCRKKVTKRGMFRVFLPTPGTP